VHFQGGCGSPTLLGGGLISPITRHMRTRGCNETSSLGPGKENRGVHRGRTHAIQICPGVKKKNGIPVHSYTK